MSQDRLVLLSTHIVSDIEYIANQILLMQNGKIFHSGTQEEILNEVPIRVWRLDVRKSEVEHWQAMYKVANLKTMPQGAELRILSEQCPDTNAKEEELTLEDVFLYYFGEKAGNNDDVL